MQSPDLMIGSKDLRGQGDAREFDVDPRDFFSDDAIRGETLTAGDSYMIGMGLAT